MTTATDVVYALETADLFRGRFDHVSHRLPYGDLDTGCGCPPELVTAWHLHCAGVRVHYPDGRTQTRRAANRDLYWALRPELRRTTTVGVCLASATTMLATAVLAGWWEASAVAAGWFTLAFAWSARRARVRHRPARLSSTVASSQLPQAFEMLTTMAALSLVLESRVASLRQALGAKPAAEFDEEMTDLLHEAATTAAQVRTQLRRMRSTGDYLDLPSSRIWVDTEDGERRINRGVVRNPDGTYLNDDLGELAGLYADWVTSVRTISSRLGWDLATGQSANADQTPFPS